MKGQNNSFFVVQELSIFALSKNVFMVLFILFRYVSLLLLFSLLFLSCGDDSHDLIGNDDGNAGNGHGNTGPVAIEYVSFYGDTLSLYAWEGSHVTILSRKSSLSSIIMGRWGVVMDSTYTFYKRATGQVPDPYPPTTLNGRVTIADVPYTCGAGCGYLGAHGIELLNEYFDKVYDQISKNGTYSQIPFYEFGRNFWFYSPQLQYKQNDPVVTGFAVFMRFMAMEATGVEGAPWHGHPFDDFVDAVKELVEIYLADSFYSWENTLGQGKGVINPKNLGGSDLFASFLFQLRDNYGGEKFVNNIWKEAAKRPVAVTTQDAVDNFFLSACSAAETNLTEQFEIWRWPLSDQAKEEAEQFSQLHF